MTNAEVPDRNVGDIISRQAAIDALNKKRIETMEKGKDVNLIWECLDAVAQVPSVEREKGRWIWDENGMDWGLGAWCCSECGSKPGTWWESDKRKNPLRCSGGRFCGNCGADMRERK